MISLFNDVALGLVGRARGGPAKVAVFSSALMGTISGSGVANVVTVGQFTIPLMKRFGYTPAFAGGVEATASHGRPDHAAGHGRRRLHHGREHRRALRGDRQGRDHPGDPLFRARRSGWCIWRPASTACVGMPRAELPSPLAALRRQWYLVLPLAVLVFLLFARLHAAVRRLGRARAHGRS